MLRFPDDEKIEIHSPTIEWLASEEFPHRILGASDHLPPVSIPDHVPDAPTLDWLQSQQFPTRPLLCTRQPAGAACERRSPSRPIRRLGDSTPSAPAYCGPEKEAYGTRMWPQPSCQGVVWNCQGDRVLNGFMPA
jgi:hypothetical protein